MNAKPGSVFLGMVLFLGVNMSGTLAWADLGSANSYKEVQAILARLASQHAEYVRMVDVGLSDSGQMIQGLAIGTGGTKNLVVATHHGNEYGSTEVAKAFAASLAETPIAGQTVYVIPVLNIPGYNSRSRYEPARGSSFDPNRDYPGPCGGEGPFNLKSTAALAQLVERENIVASATLHTFYPVVAYPWGFGTRDLSTPYDDLFIQLSKAAVVESHYDVGNSAAAIYPANGTYEDYAFWKHGAWSLLFELGYSHNPDSEAVKEMVRVNVPGLRRMMEQAPSARAENHGFSGKCDDSLRALDRHDE